MAKQRAGKRVRQPAQPFPMPPFQRSLPMLLLWAREAVMQRFRPPMHAHGLTEQQWRIIRALGDFESLEIRALSERCCIHPASLSRILPKLGEEGLVARCSNAADQRRVVVSLTPQGQRLLEDIAPLSGRVYAGLARDIGAEQLENVNRVLEDLIAALNAAKRNGKAKTKSVAKKRRARHDAGRAT
jgi:homoprotocatechuate degradation regulator HpaR